MDIEDCWLPFKPLHQWERIGLADDSRSFSQKNTSHNNDSNDYRSGYDSEMCYSKSSNSTYLRYLPNIDINKEKHPACSKRSDLYCSICKYRFKSLWGLKKHNKSNKHNRKLMALNSFNLEILPDDLISSITAQMIDDLQFKKQFFCDIAPSTLPDIVELLDRN